MKLDAVGIVSHNLVKSIEFYKLLGFRFSDTVSGMENHIESLHDPDSVRLMIDSQFAVRYDHPEEVDRIAEAVKNARFEIFKAPWDAFWGQRYAVVRDPDGYLIDLFAQLA